MKNVIQVEQEEKEKILVIRFKGKLDAISSPQMEDKLSELMNSGQINIIINLEKIDYLSSAGIRMLLIIFKKIRSLGGNFVLCSVTEPVLEVLQKIQNHPREKDLLNNK